MRMKKQANKQKQQQQNQGWRDSTRRRTLSCFEINMGLIPRPQIGALSPLTQGVIPEQTRSKAWSLPGVAPNCTPQRNGRPCKGVFFC